MEKKGEEKYGRKGLIEACQAQVRGRLRFMEEHKGFR